MRLRFQLLLFTAFLLSFITNRALHRIRSLQAFHIQECKHSDYQALPLFFEPEFSEDDCEFSAYEGISINELDEESCRRISKYFIVDRQHVYKQLYDPGSSDYPQYVIVKEADPSAFNSLGWGYYVDNKNLYHDEVENYEIVKGIDLSSIRVLSTNFIKDKNAVYLSALSVQPLTPLKDYDPLTFSVIQNGPNHETYFKDKNGVYYNLREGTSNLVKVPDADAETFEVLESYKLAKDKNEIYYEGKTLDVNDPSTFEILSDHSFKDKYNVYGVIGGEFASLPNRNACTYELVNSDNQYWWDSGYSKDLYNVYYQNVLVEGADPRTFKVDGERAFDKNFEYQGIYRIEK